ncbi:uncharacterized protein [Lepisosteus oculatus]|uniref:uncharacterized protein n=1 Tax=Lepisosteus oculatus TaxID=7918 RepID=UPI00372291D9
MDLNAKKRTPNFSSTELEVLITEIINNYSKLFGEATACTSRRQRSSFWIKTTQKVNSISQTKRSCKQVKHKWDDLRRLLVKRLRLKGRNAGSDGILKELHKTRDDNRKRNTFIERGIHRDKQVSSGDLDFSDGAPHFDIEWENDTEENESEAEGTGQEGSHKVKGNKGLPTGEPKTADETLPGRVVIVHHQGIPSLVEEIRILEAPQIVGPPIPSVACSFPQAPSAEREQEQQQQLVARGVGTDVVQIKKEPHPEFLYTSQTKETAFKIPSLGDQGSNTSIIALGHQVALLAHQIGKLTDQVSQLNQMLAQKSSCEHFQMEQVAVNHNISVTLSLLAKALASKDLSIPTAVADCSTQSDHPLHPPDQAHGER